MILRKSSDEQVLSNKSFPVCRTLQLDPAQFWKANEYQQIHTCNYTHKQQSVLNKIHILVSFNFRWSLKLSEKAVSVRWERLWFLIDVWCIILLWLAPSTEKVDLRFTKKYLGLSRKDQKHHEVIPRVSLLIRGNVCRRNSK